MYEIGRVCVKIAGRDAKGLAVIIKKLNDTYVLVDGTVRRKQCNIKHLEPTSHVLAIKEDASHEEVIAGLKELGFEIPEKQQKKEKKEKQPRPKKQKVVKKLQQAEQEKAAKEKKNKPAKKEEKSSEAKETKEEKAETKSEQ